MAVTTKSVEVVEVYTYADRSSMRVTVRFDYGVERIIEIPMNSSSSEVLSRIKMLYYEYNPSRKELDEIIVKGFRWSWVE